MDRSEARRALIRNFTALCLGLGATGALVGSVKFDDGVKAENIAIREHGVRVVAIRDGMRSGRHPVSPVTERYVARIEEIADFREKMMQGDEDVTAIYADGFIEGQEGGWKPLAFERYAAMVANSPARIKEMIGQAQLRLVGDGYSQSHSTSMTLATILVSATIDNPDRPEENFFSAQINDVVTARPDIGHLFHQSLEMRSVLLRASEMELANKVGWTRPADSVQRAGMNL